MARAKPKVSRKLWASSSSHRDILILNISRTWHSLILWNMDEASPHFNPSYPPRPKEGDRKISVLYFYLKFWARIPDELRKDYKWP